MKAGPMKDKKVGDFNVKDLWFTTVSGGDGTAYPVFFSSEEACKKYLSFEDEQFSESRPRQLSTCGVDRLHYNDPNNKA